jgi:transposase
MMHLSGHDRSQILLLPEVIDDYVGPDNPVRFIDAFVDGLDLAAASFSRVEPKVTGRPGYAPADLLKLYIYGYLNRVRSSRRLEAETHRNIEVIWLLRHLKPDFKTIADFRRDNRNAFRQVFREFVLLCRQLDLFGRELLAVDGTRIKAVNNKDRNFTRASLTQFIKAADAKPRTIFSASTRATPPRAGRTALASKTWPRRSLQSGSGVSGTRRCWRNWTRLARARSRSPTPTAERWRRIRMLRWATTCRSR